MLLLLVRLGYFDTIWHNSHRPRRVRDSLQRIDRYIKKNIPYPLFSIYFKIVVVLELNRDFVEEYQYNYFMFS